MKKKSKIAPGTVNLTTTVPKELDRQLKELAEASGLSRTKYTCEILKRAAKKRIRLKPRGYEFEVIEPEEPTPGELRSPIESTGSNIHGDREEPDEQKGKAQ